MARVSEGHYVVDEHLSAPAKDLIHKLLKKVSVNATD